MPMTYEEIQDCNSPLQVVRMILHIPRLDRGRERHNGASAQISDGKNSSSGVKPSQEVLSLVGQ